jgi:predicted GNAT superfamily acetyltransferase
MSFTLRDLETYDEMLTLRQLQREIWGLVEPDAGLYPSLLVSAARNGGMVLGAFDGETGRLVGFLFGFLGREPGGPFKLCSQTMGVLKEWRSQGIAEALKRTQRERVLAQGLPLVTWTYDPLEGPNAYLNLHKLRAISRTYWRNVYGTNFGALNAGLSSDRLVVEWWVEGKRVERKSPKTSPLKFAFPIFAIEGKDIRRHIVDSLLDLDTSPLRLEIPADIHPLKAADMELALDWRLKVREAFETYFARGYLTTDFVSKVEQGERRSHYILEKSTPELRADIGILEH